MQDLFLGASFKENTLEIEESLWKQGFKYIAGTDEAGRGPLAGPVVACACILPKNIIFPGVRDSKKIPSVERENIYKSLISNPEVIWAVSIVDAKTIDEINILRASLFAMHQAVEKLSQTPDFVIIDGRDCPSLPMPHKAYIKGDARSQSIGAASIIAKVTRDEIMLKYHEEFPNYGFDKHKGYGTEKHLEALKKYGPLPIHRKSFSPVSELIIGKSTLGF